MPSNPAQLAGIRIGAADHSAETLKDGETAAAWYDHYLAGNLGKQPSRTFEQRLRLMKNEIAMFGRVVTPELETF